MASADKAKRGLRERSPGRWEIRAWNAAAGRQESVSFDSGRSEPGAGIREARRLRAKLISDIAAGKYGGQRGTLSHAVNAYIDHRRKSGASPHTIRGYRSICRAIDAGIGQKRLDKLQTRDIDGWYADLLDS